VWNWIKHVIGIASGYVDETVRRWVSDLINGVFGFLHTIFGYVGHAWLGMFNAAKWLYTGVVHLAIETYADFYHVLRVVIPGVVRWANKFIHDVWTYAINVFHWTVKQFDWFRHWVAALLDALRRWIIHNIWDPIWHALYPVIHWVMHEGATLWHYLTHPDQLVDLLWNHLLVKIEREAWTAGRLLGRFFLSLVIHNVKTFAVLMEDIVNAIL
jgi:hypothetical protein